MLDLTSLVSGLPRMTLGFCLFSDQEHYEDPRSAPTQHALLWQKNSLIFPKGQNLCQLCLETQGTFLILPSSNWFRHITYLPHRCSLLAQGPEHVKRAKRMKPFENRRSELTSLDDLHYVRLSCCNPGTNITQIFHSPLCLDAFFRNTSSAVTTKPIVMQSGKMRRCLWT